MRLRLNKWYHYWGQVTPDEAVASVSRIGFPVAVKLDSATITHKIDFGGVILDINSEHEVRLAFEKIKANLTRAKRESEMGGVVIQRIIKEGIETIAGVTQDPLFGPLIMFGSSGIYAERLRDVALRLHPLTDIDAKGMVTSIKLAELFKGFRGSPVSDIEAIEDLFLRPSAMIEELPEIEELDFNPVKVMPSRAGCYVIDARIGVK